MSGVVPSKIAVGFTVGELAVLTVVGRQIQRGGACSLHIDAIAALAGVCRTVVKNALRAARAGGLLLVRERRIPGRKSLTNVITMISRKRKDCASSGAEMRARLGDRIGVAAVTYVLFGVKLGPALALSLILVFAVWIGWRWLCAEMKPLIILAIVLEAFDPPPSDGKKSPAWGAIWPVCRSWRQHRPSSAP